MYYTRPHEPQAPELSPEIKQRHEESKRKYPQLNLSEGEYVIRDIRRHPIGLVQIWGMMGLGIAGVLLLLVFFVGDGSGLALPLALVAALLCILFAVVGYIATYVYNANRFYLTNESVIQNIQNSLFSNREQTVSLANIEDASYNKHGLLQYMFDYGQIRLSTEGDETTYRFNFAANPAKQVATLNNAVEAFKNGRPVIGED